MKNRKISIFVYQNKNYIFGGDIDFTGKLNRFIGNCDIDGGQTILYWKSLPK